MLHQRTLIHDLQLVLILLILVLQIIHGLLICLRQQSLFFFECDLHLLLHLIEGLYVDLSWLAASGHVLTLLVRFITVTDCCVVCVNVVNDSG